MDHNYIEQFDFVDRYLMGRLATEEIERFEEHFVDCPQCIDRLKTTRDFRQDIRLLTAQQASETNSHPRKGLLGFFANRFSLKPLILSSACLLLIAVAGALLVVTRMQRLQSEIDEAKRASAQWERSYEEERQTASASDKERQRIEQELSGRISELEAKLQSEQKQRAERAAESGRWMEPQINLPIFVLNSLRGGGPTPSGSVNEIELPLSPVRFAISIALEGEVNYKDYRVTILRDQTRLVWKGDGFRPDQDNSLSAELNSISLRPGDYLLKVDGITEEGDSRVIGYYPFRIIKKP